MHTVLRNKSGDVRLIPGEWDLVPTDSITQQQANLHEAMMTHGLEEEERDVRVRELAEEIADTIYEPMVQQQDAIREHQWPHAITTELLSKLGYNEDVAERYRHVSTDVGSLTLCFESQTGREEIRSFAANATSGVNCTNAQYDFSGVVARLCESVEDQSCTAGDAARITNRIIHDQPGCFRI